MAGARVEMSEGEMSGPAAASEPTVRQLAAVLTASILGSSMAFINGTAVTLALDPIQAGLRASLSEMLWVASIYMLFMSALMLIGGAIGDFYGRRATFIAGVVLFTLASVGCALAPDAELLIAARGVQGIGAALLTPMSLTLLSDHFPKERRGMAIGIWSAVSAVMTAIGPPVGGWLAEFASWRSIFFLPLPFGLLAIVVAGFLVPKKPPPRVPESIDWAGALLTIIGFSGLAYGLITLSDENGIQSALSWSVPMGVGVVALGLLVLVELNAKSPMTPPALFTLGTFNAINAITLLLYGAMGGIFVFYPIVLTDAYGFRMNEIGTAFLGFALPVVLLTPFSSTLSRRFGIRLMLAAGSAVGIVAFALMGLSPYSGTLWGVFLSIAVFGAGIALVVPSMHAALFNATPDEAHGVASGINNAFARAATLFAIAGYGAAASVAFSAAAGPAARAAGYGAGEMLSGADLLNYQEAMIASFHVLTWISIGLCIMGLFVALIFIDPSIERHDQDGDDLDEVPGAGVRHILGAAAGADINDELAEDE
ncbi:transmembrane efflux protein [Parvularcula bermudensis HTCC2503]|uniref:Transmembrane efflux protein n=1 Tax=Parvularcula bermudensis (strain ATCC BAA-594 / HTCC2503 / KCTC 12087) TaxID=314260 RepID=E0TG82_PARBH|nr:MFS transporter [Parvularcula bermudensis]ADM09125.1 transmembrane efflux protein [Parvularcula bermudensis HTCC2503]